MTQGGKLSRLSVLLVVFVLAIGCSALQQISEAPEAMAFAPPPSCLERAKAEPGECFRCSYGQDTNEYTWNAAGVVMVLPDSAVQACPRPPGELLPTPDTMVGMDRDSIPADSLSGQF